MDPAYLTGLAIFSGSVVGALTSLTSAWLTKKHEARVQRASENKLWRQRFYAQFIDEASKLYLDALVRDQAEVPVMVSLYALISKMRMTSSADVVESAEAVIRTILTTSSRPSKSSPELQDLILKRKFVDPLLDFSEVCRGDLRDLHSGRDRSGREPGQRPSNLLAFSTEMARGGLSAEKVHDLFRPVSERLLGRAHHRAG